MGPPESWVPDCDWGSEKFPADFELVQYLLLQLNANKSMGPNGIHPRVLKELADVIVRPLSFIYQLSWESGEVPVDWKLANAIPVFKKGKKEDPANYKPVSLTSVSGYLTHLVDKGKAVDVIFYFSKAFDTVSHIIFLDKKSGIRLDVHSMMSEQLADRSCSKSYNKWGNIWLAASQVQFEGQFSSMFLSNLDMGVECTLSNFADNTKLGEAIDSLEGREALWTDLGRLEHWAITNCMKFNKDKCQIWHLTGGQEAWSAALQKWIWGQMVDGELSMSQQGDLAAKRGKCILGCIRHSTANQSKEVVVPL
ncbi:hypothetical protein QYF61_007070 [Mycteria americana]|uniref:Rna-directed dna polymerase from mobile element jockey-like n=1 Tax=Mycteria americana TaxID=33587 RepID=A0AAN7RT88_MYCAM|nr:hypothetical protein QYF61_007070 [Mycteria americana]